MKNLKDLGDTIRCTNIIIRGVPGEGVRKERAERIFKEIMAKNDPNLKEDVNPRSSMNTK